MIGWFSIGCFRNLSFIFALDLKSLIIITHDVAHIARGILRFLIRYLYWHKKQFDLIFVLMKETKA